MRAMQEETFGPIMLLNQFDEIDEALRQANSTPYGLAAYVLTNDLRTAIRAYEGLKFGIVGVNDMTPATAEAPFGGVKQSGLRPRGLRRRAAGIPGDQVRLVGNLAHRNLIEKVGQAMAAQGLANNLTEYGDKEFALYLRRSFAKAMGFSDEALGKPIVGIINTYSELNNCHRHFPQLVDAVKRGVWQAGGLPLEFPTISLGEVFLAPTSMLYRNLMSMDVEAMIRAQPLDAVVLTGGCDKTLPALLMGAASAGLPAIAVAAGPMLTSQYEGERLGACTDCRRFWARYRRNEISREQHRPGRRPAGTDAGHLQRHGHGQHDGLRDRGARHDAARQRRDPCRLRRPHAQRRSKRQAGGAADRVGAHPRQDHDPGRLRKCPARPAGDRRLDQRRHPPHRDRRTAGH